MRRSISILGTALVGVLGCYGYRPVGATIPADARIRVQFAVPRPVTESDGARREQLTDVSSITGTLLSVRGDTITVRPTAISIVDHRAEPLVLGRVVTLVRDAATSVEVLQKDRDRTAVAWIVGGIAGFYVLLVAAAVAVVAVSAQ